MSQQNDSKDETQATHAMRLFAQAKRHTQFEDGAIGVFMRATLAILYMYLIVVSYLMFGIAGPVFIGILFLTALFTPHLYTALRNLTEKRKAQKTSPVLNTESRQSH